MSESVDHGGGDTRSAAKQGTVFPYTNLEDAVGVARAMYEAGGVPMARDQIAMQMNANPDSSTFAIKVSAAQLFGLISRADGKLQLTEAGSGILSPDDAEAQSYRVSAFLNVELYRRLVDHFRGKILPPKEGIETALVSFGVAPKQKDRARQSFERSAAYAGYLNASKDRLVPPIQQAIGASTSRLQQQLGPEVVETVQKIVPKKPSDDPSEEKLIRGMLDRLPQLGESWPIADRVRWLRRFAHNLAMVYDPYDDTEIEIKFTPLVPLARVAVPPPPPPKAPPPPPSPPPKDAGPSWEPSDLDDEIPF